MGLFGSDEPEGRAGQLAHDAKSDTVTKKRLTTKSKSLTQSHFADYTLLEILAEDEQPHYYFYHPSKGISRDNETSGGGMSGEYRSICCVTNKRVLLFTDGNRGAALQYGAITGTETSSGMTKNRLSISTQEHEYTFYIAAKTNYKEIKQAAADIEQKASIEPEPEHELEDVTNFLPLFPKSEPEITAEVAIAEEDRGSYVSHARLEKVKDVLDPGEVVHYITRGTTVDTEGSGAGTSLFGDNRSRKSGTRGYVRAVITDKRVVVKIPQFLGNDERSVSYSSITSADLDTGLINKRITLQTPGQTYHIEVQEPGKGEVREAVRFIRKKISDANKPQVVQTTESSEPDPVEQLEKLQSLYEKGALSEEEFEDKKAVLLDKI